MSSWLASRLSRLADDYRLVVDHLTGTNRIDFRRLFLATSRGRRCWESDQAKFTPKECVQELENRREGYWMPAWTWPLIREVLKRDHQFRVKNNGETKLWSVFKPVVSGGAWDEEGDINIQMLHTVLQQAVTDMKARKEDTR